MILRKSLIILSLLAVPLCISAQNNSNDTTWNQLDQTGRKQGWWKKYYPDGTIMYKGLFVDNAPRGIFTRYFENGNRKAILRFSPDGKTARATLFYMNGERAAEGKYIEEQKDSTWNYYSYYTHTLSLVENYKAGKKYGPVLKYYDNGKVAEAIDWESDIKHGQWYQYFEDGTLRLSSAYSNDKINGEYKIFSAPGKPAIDGKYKEGNMDGKWLYYDAEGQVEFELIYDNGKAQNDSILEVMSRKFMEELEKNLGAIPEPDLENFLQEKK